MVPKTSCVFLSLKGQINAENGRKEGRRIKHLREQTCFVSNSTWVLVVIYWLSTFCRF